jgi:hypothetical protein
MSPRFWIGTILATVFAVLIFGLGMHVGAQFSVGAGWWGPGMMGGYGMHPLMMGPNPIGRYGMGPWMMAPPLGSGQATLNLTVDDAKDYFQRWLAWQGNPRLKLGAVTEKDADTITADILTKDKEVLVQRFAVNRHTGFPYSSED